MRRSEKRDPGKRRPSCLCAELPPPAAAAVARGGGARRRHGCGEPGGHRVNGLGTAAAEGGRKGESRFLPPQCVRSVCKQQRTSSRACVRGRGAAAAAARPRRPAALCPLGGSCASRPQRRHSPPPRRALPMPPRGR